MDDNNTLNNSTDNHSTDNHDLVILSKAVLGNLINNLKKRALFISLIPTVLAVVLALNYYYQFQLLKNDPQKVAQQETRDLVSTVSKLIVLPNGEEPTVATVADADKLKDQVFFAKAQKGDKVLIYTNAKKAILYNPTLNKIIEVAPLNIGNPSNNLPEK